MVEVVWSEPALADLDAIADYIALENPQAAKNLVARVFQHADQLDHHPEGGRKVRELRGSGYREVIEPPCRVIYRYNKSAGKAFVLHVVRSERKLRRSQLLSPLEGET